MSEYLLSTTLSLLPGARYMYERRVVRKRFTAEKAGFTSALNAFAHHLTVSLDCGNWNHLTGWTRQRNSVLPKFFGKELSLLFSPEGDIYHPESDKQARQFASYVRRILQVCLVFKKFEAKPSTEMKNESYDSFVAVQQDLKVRRETGFYSDLESDPILAHARSFIEGIVSKADFTTGSFGPGENLQGVNPQMLREHQFNSFTFLNDEGTNCVSPLVKLASTIQSQQFRNAFRDPILREGIALGEFELPSDYRRKGFMIPMLRHDAMSYEQKRSARMIAVPKTAKKARLIGKMHTDYVYIQSCIATGIRQAISRDPFYDSIFPLLDQQIPSQRAINSSADGLWATVDLSAASDWLSADLVKLLVPSWFWKILVDTRAITVTIVRDDKTQETHECYSYGQMGDGTTFIILCLVCAALSYGAIVTHPDWYRGDFEVFPLIDYGDDIQVPTAFVSRVMRTLEQYGLKVNREKSFTQFPGYFRESCDGWGAFGYPVKPVWIKSIPNVNQFETVASVLASARLLDQRGYVKTAAILYEQIEAALGIKLPEAHSTDPYFGRFRRTKHTYRYIQESGLRKVPVWRVRTHQYSTSLLGDFYNAVRAPNENDFWRDKQAGIRHLVGFKLQSVHKIGGLVEVKSCYLHPLLDL